MARLKPCPFNNKLQVPSTALRTGSSASSQDGKVGLERPAATGIAVLQ
jgi:hypothetical protein